MLVYDTPMESLLYEILDLDGEGPFDCPVCKYDNWKIYEDFHERTGPVEGKIIILKSWYTDPPLMNRRYHALLEITCSRCHHKFRIEDQSY